MSAVDSDNATVIVATPEGVEIYNLADPGQP